MTRNLLASIRNRFPFAALKRVQKVLFFLVQFSLLHCLLLGNHVLLFYWE